MEVLEKGKGKRYMRRTFHRVHYEDMWSPYEKCREIVKHEWKDGSCWTKNNPVELFRRKSKDSLADLKIWSKQEFNGRDKKLKQLKNKLKEMKNQFSHFDNREEMQRIENQIDNILIDEEIFWKQRSRADWLKEGDRNTKVFHAKASARKKKNRISGLEDENGKWIEEDDKVEQLICDYFTHIFTTTNPSQSQLHAALETVPAKLTEDMRKFMDQPFTTEEVEGALAQMCPTKAPGPDGLPAAFFQKHWSSVKEGVFKTCLHILNEGGNLAPLNHTFIALIPKTQKPRKVSEFRPISLCNVIYRIVSKTMANRLKQILDDIISPMQSAFVPSRLITDNVIIAYECLNKIRQSKGNREGLVDISKAYDRIEWVFVKGVMQKLGFPKKWINLVMNCISTASFSVLINGVAKGLIHPQRGLRQGCPLSPYLFIMCAEVFSNMLVHAEHQNLVHGLRFSKNISVTHLLFADDSLIFSRASSFDCKNLKRLFDCYTAASGQVFNYEKSSMFFSSNTSSSHMEEIKGIFALNVVSKHEKYLGLPSMVGRKKTSFFNNIKLRLLTKLSSWESKFFSNGGKEVLIKAVAQAVPAYAMSVFKIPHSFCDDIEKAIARFWWGSSETKRSIHWIRWERLCHAKIRGGLGFRDFSSFNQALIAKQGWRILQHPDSLMAKILKAKYFKHSGFMDAKLGSHPSFVWRSILWGRQLPSLVPNPDLPPETVVADLIDESHQWKEDMSGYQLAVKQKFQNYPSCSDVTKSRWEVIWATDLPEKVKIFIWRAAQNLLPTVGNLWRRRVVKDYFCQRCNCRGEDVFHALLECRAAKRLVVAVCWAIWYSRNRLVFEGKDEDPKNSVARAIAMVESYRRIKVPNEQNSPGHSRISQLEWANPPKGCYKVNVDAAINVSNQKAGLGVVIRNSVGKVVAAAAEAVLFGIQSAQQAAVFPIIIESDSKEVVDLSLKKKISKTEIEWKIAEIQANLENQNVSSLSYVPRSCNSIAHSIAKIALGFESQVFWLENFPEHIRCTLAKFIN
ncbi:reverse transcriptase domain-containing protein [Citrus sinensis]|nr:reverse transcriptase domain-containing protein [Citrus sinensis]